MTHPPDYPGPSPQPTTPPKKKRNPFAIGCASLIGLFILIVIIAVGAGGGSKTPSAPNPAVVPTQAPAVASQPAATTEQPPATHHVIYAITGKGTSSASTVTYNSDGTAQIGQDTGVALPWRKEIDVPLSILNIYQVSAQNGGGGSITCTITVDGKVVSQQTSNGQYAIADCNSH